jgi:hypothetical protein
MEHRLESMGREQVSFFHLATTAGEVVGNRSHIQPWWSGQQQLPPLLYKCGITLAHGGEVFILQGGLATHCHTFQHSAAASAVQNIATLVALGAKSRVG